MVVFFKSTVVEPAYTLFMGFDKHENEELIRWGWPEDVWFHVDKVSSAHVYIRLKTGETLEDVPHAVIEDCAQLVKANSIKGNKMNNVDIVYTMWANLKKTAGMDVGQVGFHRDRQVHKIKVEKRQNEIINRLNKTREEREVDFRASREERDRQERDGVKAQQRDQRVAEHDAEKQRQADSEARSYDRLFTAEKMTSNYDDGNDSDDFM